MTDGGPAPTSIDATQQRQLAVDLFNGVWRLLEKPDRTPEDDDRMLHAAHASRYHWEAVGEPVNLVRGEWQCSRVYAMLGRAEPALHHARRSLKLCEANGIGGFDLAFAYEALARAHAIAGDQQQASEFLRLARSAGERIAEGDDRELFLNDLASISGV
jgi:hypothetical protein